MTRLSVINLSIVVILILFFSFELNEAGWTGQCWKKHVSGAIQTDTDEFRRPYGIICTFQCLLWFPPLFPYCEFIFDLRMSRHFSELPDCYTIMCNETFSLLG